MHTKHHSCYIHIPFCLNKCLFCSFAIAVSQDHRHDDYAQAIIKEIDAHESLQIATLYFGGGTPSRMPEDLLVLMINHLRSKWHLNRDIEITMEANPEDISRQRVDAWIKAGVNRVSLGAQSFDDRWLKFLGRAHTANKIYQAVDVLHSSGIKNISIDLMYGFPGQTHEELKQDLSSIIALQLNHVSIYELTIEPNSRFHAQRLLLDDAHLRADYYRMIVGLLSDAGIRQYEVSNFAKAGFESEHNMSYWQGQPYIGLGMGAHSFTGTKRYWNIDRLSQYLDAIGQGKSIVSGEEILSNRTLFLERLVFGLRMNRGIDIKSLTKEMKESLTQEQQQLIKELLVQGYAKEENGCLTMTIEGRLRLDEIAARLMD